MGKGLVKKRILAILLCAVMIVTSADITAFAAAMPDETAVQLAEQKESTSVSEKEATDEEAEEETPADEDETEEEDSSEQDSSEEDSSTEGEDASKEEEDADSSEEQKEEEEDSSEEDAEDSEEEKPLEEETSDKEEDADISEEEDLAGLTSGIFTYNVENNAAIITGLLDNTLTEITIPVKVDNYPVAKIGESAFKDNTAITKVTFASGSQVKRIDSYAFRNCTSLTDINLPANLSSTGAWVFCGCTSLEEIEIPASLTECGSIIFRDCSNLKSITFEDGTPENPRVIPAGICNSAKALEAVEIPANVSAINESAFQDCIALKTVTFASGSQVRRIDSYAFNGCTSLTDINLPASLSSTGTWVFRGCTSLEEIEIPASLTECSGTIFINCSNLKTITFEDGTPENPRVIPAGICNSAKALEAVEIPANVSVINEEAFKECTALKTVTFASGSRLERIKTYAFSTCNNLESINLPNSLTCIENSAFWKCAGLKTIKLPASLETVGGYIFAYCTSLTSAEFSEGLKTLGGNTFIGCTSLTSVKLPDSLETTGTSEFENCESLESIRIPAKLYSCHDNIFKGCTSLTSVIFEDGTEEEPRQIPDNICAQAPALKTVVIPAHTKQINGAAFWKCPELTTVTFAPGSQVKTIAGMAFRYCSKLKTINLPDSLETTGSVVFEGCTSLESIEIPAKLYYCQDTIFLGCTSLTSVIFKDGTEEEPRRIPNNICAQAPALQEVEIPAHTVSINQTAFCKCPELTTVTFEKNSMVEEIHDRAFQSCGKLETINLPDTLKKIGSGAFSGCAALKEVEIGYRLTEIGDGAFANCTALEKVYFNSVNASLGGIPFNNAKNVTIYGYKYSTVIAHAQAKGITYEIVDAMRVENDGLAVPNDRKAFAPAQILFDKKLNHIAAGLDEELHIITNAEGVAWTSEPLLLRAQDGASLLEIDRIEEREGSLIGFLEDTEAGVLDGRYKIEEYEVEGNSVFAEHYKKINAYAGNSGGMNLASLAAHYLGAEQSCFATGITTERKELNTFSYDKLSEGMLQLSGNSKLSKTVGRLQSYQYTEAYQNFEKNSENMVALADLTDYAGIKNADEKKKSISIIFSGNLSGDGKESRHAVLLDTAKNVEYATSADKTQYGVNPEETWYKLHLIDSNYPSWDYEKDGKNNPKGLRKSNLQDCYNKESILLISEDEAHWKYCPKEGLLVGDSDGSMQLYKVDSSTFTNQLSDMESWLLGEVPSAVAPEGKYTIHAITDNLTVKNAGNTVIFQMTNGVVSTGKDIFCKPAGYDASRSWPNKFSLTLPGDVAYTVEASGGTWLMTDNDRLCGISSEQAVSVKIGANLNDITATSTSGGVVEYHLGNRVSASSADHANINWDTWQEAGKEVTLTLSDEGLLRISPDDAISGRVNAWRSNSTEEFYYVKEIPSETINHYQENIVDLIKKCVRYSIKYYDGEEEIKLTPSYYTMMDTVTLPDSPAKEGYDFHGWYEDAEYKGEQVTQIPEGTEGNKVFYAKWARRITQSDDAKSETTLSVVFPGAGTYIYTGSAIKPAIEVIDNETVLKKGTDYTVKFENNTNAATLDADIAKAGKAPLVKASKAPVVIVTGKGNYAGKSVRLNFNIYAKDLGSGTGITISHADTLAVKSRDAAQQLPLTLTYGSKKLTKDKDYRVTYDYYGTDGEEPIITGLYSVTKAGRYRVNINEIRQDDLSGNRVRNTFSSANYRGKAESFIIEVQGAGTVLSKAKVTLKKSKLKQGQAYSPEQVIDKVTINDKKKFNLANATQRADFLSKFDVTEMDEDFTARTGKAYITISAREDSGYYGTKTVAVTITGAKISDMKFTLNADSSRSFDYNGHPQTPQYTIEDADGTELLKDIDYTVSYLKGKKAITGEPSNAGEYTAVYKGTGIYEGTKKITFKIKQIDFAVKANQSSLIVTAEDMDYQSGATTTDVTVTYINKLDEDMTLVAGTDYKVAYVDNTKPGTAYVSITGKGNFKGTFKRAASFTIGKRDFASDNISVVVQEVFYKAGSDITPKVTVYDGKRKIKADYYTISCEDGGRTLKKYRLPDEEEYANLTVTVKAKAGNKYYEADTEAEGTLHIYTKKITKDNTRVTLAASENAGGKWYYTGAQITPEVTSVLYGSNKTEVPEDEDDGYVVSYGKNVNAGYGSVIIKGTGTYGSQKTVKFSILTRWLQWLFG